MDLWIIITFCILALVFVVGGYVYMFLHIMREDPRELEYRKKLGQHNGLVPHKYKNK